MDIEAVVLDFVKCVAHVRQLALTGTTQFLLRRHAGNMLEELSIFSEEL